MINLNELKQDTQKLSILFVEDHDELRTRISDILVSIFGRVDSSVNGEEALAKYKIFAEENNKNYDIVLSDIQMPRMDGIELTKEIYKLNPEQTIIILSAYDETQYLLELINIGIEQFIKKPIEYDELMLAFSSASKKINKLHTPDFDTVNIRLSQDVVYSKESKALKSHGENIYLTKFEIIFLELLLSSLGKIFSNDDIVGYFSSVGESIDPANIRKLVSKLRKKLPENSLESIYGIGYKFLAYSE